MDSYATICDVINITPHNSSPNTQLLASCNLVQHSVTATLLQLTLIHRGYNMDNGVGLVAPRVHNNKSVQLPYGINCHHLRSMP